MASVTTPEMGDIIAEFQADPYLEASPDEQALLASLIPTGEAWVALKVTAATYTSSSLSSYQVQALQRAVKTKTWQLFLRSPQGRAILGTYAPLLHENSEAFTAYIGDLEAEAEELVSLAATGTESSPFAKPSVGAHGFTYTAGTDRSPEERNELISERDGVSAQDLTNG